MKRILLFAAIVMVSTMANAQAFFGVSESGNLINYCGTSEIIGITECDCSVVVTLANEYRVGKADTLYERIPSEDMDFFLRYLSVGDKVDFCIEDDNFIVKRVRLIGGTLSHFVGDNPIGVTRVLRIKDDGTLILENGLIIRNPKDDHEIGDEVAYKEDRQLFMMAKEIRRRVH